VRAGCLSPALTRECGIARPHHQGQRINTRAPLNWIIRPSAQEITYRPTHLATGESSDLQRSRAPSCTVSYTPASPARMPRPGARNGDRQGCSDARRGGTASASPSPDAGHPLSERTCRTQRPAPWDCRPWAGWRYSDFGGRSRKETAELDQIKRCGPAPSHLSVTWPNTPTSRGTLRWS